MDNKLIDACINGNLMILNEVSCQNITDVSLVHELFRIILNNGNLNAFYKLQHLFSNYEYQHSRDNSLMSIVINTGNILLFRALMDYTGTLHMQYTDLQPYMTQIFKLAATHNYTDILNELKLYTTYDTYDIKDIYIEALDIATQLQHTKVINELQSYWSPQTPLEPFTFDIMLIKELTPPDITISIYDEFKTKYLTDITRDIELDCCICIEKLFNLRRNNYELGINDINCDISILPCGHIFHKTCLTNLQQSSTNYSCPTCRHKITSDIQFSIMYGTGAQAIAQIFKFSQQLSNITNLRYRDIYFNRYSRVYQVKSKILISKARATEIYKNFCNPHTIKYIITYLQTYCYVGNYLPITPAFIYNFIGKILREYKNDATGGIKKIKSKFYLRSFI